MTQPYYHDRQQFGGPAKPKRRVWPWIAGAFLGLCLLGTVISAVTSRSDDNAVVNPPETTPATAAVGAKKAAPPAKPAVPAVKAGTWEVGTEVKPGTYTTTAGDDAHCYWAQLSDFDGDFDSIIANGNLDSGEHGRLTVKKADKGLELTGDCTWKRAG